MSFTRADVRLIVDMETWEGERYPVALAPGLSRCLVGEFGQGFDIRGPQVTMCRECGEPLFVERGGQVLGNYQRHLSREHGISAPLLP